MNTKFALMVLGALIAGSCVEIDAVRGRAAGVGRAGVGVGRPGVGVGRPGVARTRTVARQGDYYRHGQGDYYGRGLGTAAVVGTALGVAAATDANYYDYNTDCYYDEMGNLVCP